MVWHPCDFVESQTKKVNDQVHKARKRPGAAFGLLRDRHNEAYYCHAGDSGGTSLCTIWRSWPQIRLILLGGSWYMFQTYTYMVMANFLVYFTFHRLPTKDCAYPGSVVEDGVSFNHTALTDLGFLITPDLSYRPWWLKMMFVDLNVFLAQVLPPILLCFTGQTKRFIVYVGTVGFVNIMKGVIQLLTILPPANGGQSCWHKNFQEDEIQTVQSSLSWIFTEPWGMAHGCNDMLWSGHTAQTCIGFLFIASCLKRLGVSPCINVFIVLYFIGYVWSVLACRMHYSIDVLSATMIGCFVFTNSSWRQNMWMFANRVVCNEPFDDEWEDTSERVALDAQNELLQEGSEPEDEEEDDEEESKTCCIS